MTQNHSFLFTPSNTKIDPPVDTKVQELPVNSLSWEDFEKLILRIVELEFQISDCEIYGRKGQKQDGIDIYALKENAKYNSYQCKRYQKLTVSDLKSAIKEFVDGEWLDKSDCFYFCTSSPMDDVSLQDEFEIQKSVLEKNKVKLKKLDKINVEKILKKNPNIVYDFFGEAWVVKFNGKKGLESISSKRKLDANKVREYRGRLAKFYSAVFNTTDHGIPLPGASMYMLQDRYIIPDVIPYRQDLEVAETISIQKENKEEIEDIIKEDYYENEYSKPKPNYESTSIEVVSITERINFDAVRLNQKKLIVLGEAGFGKSSLLRYLTLDILSETPVLRNFSLEMGHLLPVWLPFAFLCKNISDDGNLNIPEILQLWLKSHGEEELFELVNEALEDERLLLVVDGIDEWNSVSHAKLAMSRITIHLNLNNTFAIFSSRPYGYRLIEESIRESDVISLAPFSLKQQKQFTSKWFEKWVSSLERVKDGLIEKLGNSFQNEIEKSPDLTYIAQNPLLLGILISLKINNSRLPRSKVEALKIICDYLINQHPAERRSQANVVIDDSWEFELIDVFSEIAFNIQKNSNDGVILKSDARAIIESYLKREMGFPIAKAKKDANELIEIGANNVGIILEKSSVELAFIHRQFQEYLSAYYLSNSENDFVIKTIKEFANNPTWHQVIINLFSLVPQRKKLEFQDYLTALKEAKGGRESEVYNEFIEFEVGVTLLNTPIKIVNEKFSKLQSRFEYETNFRVKEILWDILLKALDNSKIKNEVKEYLFAFYPYRYNYTDYRVISLRNLGHLSSTQLQFLIKVLINGNIHQQRDASNTLNKFVGDKAVRAQIIELLHTSSNPRIVALTINSLISDQVDKKWKNEILVNYNESIPPEISLFHMKLKVHLGMHDHLDLEKFLKIQYRQEYIFEDEIVNIFINGWPTNEDLMHESLSSVRKHHHGKISSKNAWKILFHCFNEKENTIERIKEELKNEDYPFIGMDAHRGWDLIAYYFKNNSKLADSVDDWMEKQKFSEPEVSFASQVSLSQRAKDILLGKLGKGSFPHWTVSALYEGWGSEAEVLKELKEFYLKGDLKRTVYAAHYISKVFSDSKTKGIEILEQMLQSDSPFRDRAVLPYIELDKDKFEKDYLKRLLTELETLKDYQFGQYENSLEVIVKNFPDNKIVEEHLSKRTSSSEDLNVLIRNYPEKSALIDKHIIKSRPIPVSLRFKLIERISQHNIMDVDIIERLGQYRKEGEDEIKTGAAINYFTSLKELDPEKIITIAKEDAFYKGFDVDTVRAIGFAGYFIAGRLDEYFELKDPQGGYETSPNFLFSPSYDRISESMIKLLEDNFEELQSATGNMFQKLTRGNDEKEDDFWSYWASRAEGKNAISIQIEDYIKSNQDVQSVEFLEFLKKTSPKSNLTKNICLSVLKRNESSTRNDFYYGKDIAVVAGETLGEYFNTDDNVKKYVSSFREEIESDLRNIRFHTGKVVALCIGWPNSEVLLQLFTELKENNLPINESVGFNLKFLFRDDDNVIQFLEQVLNDPNDWSHLRRHFLKPLIRRVKVNEGTSNELKSRMLSSSNNSEIISIHELLKYTNKLDEEIGDWKNKLKNTNFYGYNLIKNRIQPISEILYDLNYFVN